MPEGVDAAMRETLYSGFIAEGKKVQSLTTEVADFLGNPRTVLMNSCTTALTIAYALSGVEPGTEVITTPLTCVASNTPITQLGGKPIWADVDRETGMTDPALIESLITPKTRAITILHKEGDPARIDEILAIARRHKIKVIEDAAHAFGAKYKGKAIGLHGDFVCFSFQAIKHMTTGDGGALACANESDYERAKKMKWFGIDKFAARTHSPWLDDITEIGLKGNMNDIAATIGLEQIKHIKRIVRACHENGHRYMELLRDVPGIRHIRRDAADYSIFWAFCLLAENRGGLIRKLEEAGITAAQIHPRNDAYSMFKTSRRSLPNVDWFSDRELSLPCGWWLEAGDVERICGVIKRGW